jgi:hypothetical protein
MAMVRIVDIMLGQTLSRSVKDSVIFCSVICYELFNFRHEWKKIRRISSFQNFLLCFWQTEFSESFSI